MHDLRLSIARKGLLLLHHVAAHSAAASTDDEDHNDNADNGTLGHPTVNTSSGVLRGRPPANYNVRTGTVAARGVNRISNADAV
jgi:hypothetical protein